MCHFVSPTSILMDIPSSHTESMHSKSRFLSRNDELVKVFCASPRCHDNQARRLGSACLFGWSSLSGREEQQKWSKGSSFSQAFRLPRLFHVVSLTQKESGRLEPSHGSLSVLRTSEWSLELVLMSPNFWGNRDYFPKSLYCGHANLDKLNAVSTTKGCYVGQETYTRYMHAVDWSSLSQTKAQKARSSSSLFVGSFFLSTSWCLLFLRDGV